MYRCGICQKPFTSFKQIAVNSNIYGDYFVSVTPCCRSQNYSCLTWHSLSTVSGGSAGTFRQLSESEVVELALNWVFDFQKERTND